MNGSGSLRRHSQQQHQPCPGTRGAPRSLALPMVGYSAFLLQLWVSAETPIDMPGWKPRKPIISKSWNGMLRITTGRRWRQVDHEFSVSLQYRVKLWPKKRLFASLFVCLFVCLFKIKNRLLKARGTVVITSYFYIIFKHRARLSEFYFNSCTALALITTSQLPCSK